MRAIGLRRALVVFVVAYLVVSTLGFGLYLVLAASMDHSPWAAVEVRDNAPYQLTTKLLPCLNLVTWIVAARFYFEQRTSRERPWRLALLWVGVAAAIDYVVFVLPDHALAVTARGFYLEQGVWIYLTYAAIGGGAVAGWWWARQNRTPSTTYP